MKLDDVLAILVFGGILAGLYLVYRRFARVDTGAIQRMAGEHGWSFSKGDDGTVASLTERRTGLARGWCEIKYLVRVSPEVCVFTGQRRVGKSWMVNHVGLIHGLPGIEGRVVVEPGKVIGFVERLVKGSRGLKTLESTGDDVFDARFRVSASDPDRAHRLLSRDVAGLITALPRAALPNTGPFVEFEDGAVAVIVKYMTKAEEIEQFVGQVVHLRQILDEQHRFTDHRR